VGVASGARIEKIAKNIEFELVQYTFYQYFYLACKYKDILHDYFPLKLIGKYLLLYNNTFVICPGGRGKWS
jgi:hypothetical protein